MRLHLISILNITKDVGDYEPIQIQKNQRQINVLVLNNKNTLRNT